MWIGRNRGFNLEYNNVMNSSLLYLIDGFGMCEFPRVGIGGAYRPFPAF